MILKYCCPKLIQGFMEENCQLGYNARNGCSVGYHIKGGCNDGSFH